MPEPSPSGAPTEPRRHQTPRSRRTLKLPELALTALRERKAAQAAERLKVGDLARHRPGLHHHGRLHAGASTTSAASSARLLALPASGDDWVPRELRHTFVSIMSVGGVPVEEIARVAAISKPAPPNWSTAAYRPSSQPAPSYSSSTVVAWPPPNFLSASPDRAKAMTTLNLAISSRWRIEPR